MTIIPFQVGEVADIYNRVLKSRDFSAWTDNEPAELKDVVNISAEAKRHKILEEAQDAVLNQIKEK